MTKLEQRENVYTAKYFHVMVAIVDVIAGV